MSVYRNIGPLVSFCSELGSSYCHNKNVMTATHVFEDIFFHSSTFLPVLLAIFNYLNLFSEK